jgi:protoporphyrinogen oxidase
VLVKRLALENKTDLTTVGNIVPDCWVYVQDRSVKMGRFQIYNNWSPYLVKDLEHTVWVGLEYFCTEGDAFWNQSEEAFTRLGVEEMLRIGLIRDRSDVLDTHMEKVKKAYPAYFDTYDEMDTLRDWLNTIPNLFCVGRNGQHRYNNIDHSMCTSFETVKCIVNGSTDRTDVWNVNTETEYHETAGAEQKDPSAEESGEEENSMEID